MQATQASEKPTSSFSRAIAMMFPQPEFTEKGPATINSKDFASACAEKQTCYAFVQENASGFALFVRLKKSQDIHVLVTTSNLVRNWASLNSLLAFLKSHSFNLAEVTIRLNQTESEPA